MSKNVGNFFWYELMTTDTVAAQNFYSAVVGWNAEDSGVPGANYTVLSVGNHGVAGIMEMPQDMCESGGRPGWVGYIEVDDTDAYAEKIQQKGGTIFCPPMDIPNIGRFAMVADPHGAVFNIMKPTTDSAESCEGDVPTACASGMIGWRELHAGNGEEAWEFYADLFGWTKAMGHDMGDLGVYQTFNYGDAWTGGIMTKMEDSPVPFWTYYFNVDDIHAAVTRVTDNGGKILMGPHEVPGGNMIVQCCDPQGAIFALMQLTP